MQGLLTPVAAANRIEAGERLLIAGDEALLTSLPRGDWIGGTIPYFMAEQGGLHSREHVFVTAFPSAVGAKVRRYDAASLPGLSADHRGHGFTALLIPAFSEVHADYAKNVAHYPDIFDRPVVGWISGVALEDIGKVRPKVFDGTSCTASADHAVALHVELPPEEHALVDIINLFEPGGGARIRFADTGFSATDAFIDGQPENLACYFGQNGIDSRLPLVADYNGALVNVSIRNVDPARGVVDFYAPVFPDVDYRIAAPIGDYVSGFAAKLDPNGPVPAFSCNCILNYVHASLEGRSTKPLVGPMTFGEIAYMLLNQTAVHLHVTRGS
jgi:hypothetical protein